MSLSLSCLFFSCVAQFVKFSIFFVSGMVSKSALISEVAKTLSLSTEEAKKRVGFVLDGIKHALQKDKEFRLVGFGTFSVKDVPEREGRHPKTGKLVSFAASKRIVFRPGKELIDLVKAG